MSLAEQGPVRQAVVLAAGRGSRMGTLTDEAPKCLCPLAGRPILAWTLDALKRCGIEEVLVVAGWRHERLAGWGDELIVNPDWATSNMVRSLQLARGWLRRAPTLVAYGDGAYGTRALRPVLAHASAFPDQGILVPGDSRWRDLWSRRFADPLGDAETWRSADGLLVDIGRRPASLDEVQGQFMGLLKTTPPGWRRIEESLDHWEAREGPGPLDKMDMTSLLARLIGQGRAVHCLDVPGGWVEIDSDEDRRAVEAALPDPAFAHDFRV